MNAPHQADTACARFSQDLTEDVFFAELTSTGSPIIPRFAELKQHEEAIHPWMTPTALYCSDNPQD
ncbi:hypothetical protein PGT21_026508 [Puccinia graminis f. sp. tritici]|uniref:Uncharacterized protein n=1 Tax=Puccinia graminis f. sp. tritici TaxID=56615 RepID=A0A5B0M0L7_PUCGR|nr:hypothetical protein PGT21_026508 [Puccinia graminis f. sp. tritici]